MLSLSHTNPSSHYPYHPPRTSFATFCQSLYHRRLARSGVHALPSSFNTPILTASPISMSIFPSSPPPPSSSSTSSSPHPYSHFPTPGPNQPLCTCRTSSSCPLHNGTWDLIKRKGYELVLSRIHDAERQLNTSGSPGIVAGLEGSNMDVQIPSVEEVVRSVIKEGWNLRSEAWRWG